MTPQVLPQLVRAQIVVAARAHAVVESTDKPRRHMPMLRFVGDNRASGSKYAALSPEPR